MQDPNDEMKRPIVERERFGGTDRPARDVDREKLPPISSTEMSRGPAELTDERGSRVNWKVFLISSAVILAFSVWAMLMPDFAQSTMKSIVDWIATNLGWYYVLTVTVVIAFVLWVALSKEGSVRLGPDHSRPQYNLFTWVAMLFAAGVGIDMLFYSVTGPITQFLQPVNADPESAAAAQDAVVWTMFHYGIAGWSMYSLLGMAMGYFAYRWGMPLSIRAVLYPLLGKRVRGATGDVIDIFALVGTVFGVATSMGIGVVLLNVGFSEALRPARKGLGPPDRPCPRRSRHDDRRLHLGCGQGHPSGLRAQPVVLCRDDALHPRSPARPRSCSTPWSRTSGASSSPCPSGPWPPSPTSMTVPPGWVPGPCSSGPSGSPGVPSSDCSLPASLVDVLCANSSSPPSPHRCSATSSSSRSSETPHWRRSSTATPNSQNSPSTHRSRVGTPSSTCSLGRPSSSDSPRSRVCSSTSRVRIRAPW